jgi:hypothetical protein
LSLAATHEGWAHARRYLASYVLSMRPSHLALAASIAFAPCVAGAQQSLSMLRGEIRSLAGGPVADVSIDAFRDSVRLTGTRSDRAGRFELRIGTPGTYLVRFRKIGFDPIQYRWTAQTDSTITIRPVINPGSTALDTVSIVGEQSRTSIVSGIVVDDAGNAVPDALVEMLGTGKGGMTRADGRFEFGPLRPGNYVFRARKIGLEPASSTLLLVGAEERGLALRMQRLPSLLRAAEIRERSGYGSDQGRWVDLDQRLRWSGTRSFVFATEDLSRYSGMSLDIVAAQTGALWTEGRKSGSAAMLSISSAGTNGKVGDGGARQGVPGDACILLNGKSFVRQPLSSIRAEDVELLEIYPSRSEVTSTVANRMHFQCERSPLGTHPTWYVIWMKGAR